MSLQRRLKYLRRLTFLSTYDVPTLPRGRNVVTLVLTSTLRLTLVVAVILIMILFWPVRVACRFLEDRRVRHD